ncbi:uncharacterized protein LOC127247052 [Andrographis paniculata]|uniref:uncharacterized protein LOC127247052 n=1 Tax=Andrographis paniculata TaxID=175694 RepID=UPI0021E78164|nr:uncharacterized protein LOC127247052 [Andrographis paniculata]XP_051124697.1 uncharacterized protein LOC127247052 [Andrographis paniculata]XP_051124698.1 uncharacterized protein LOC127247052 [Andrographis paniculata]XP_051124699.1 uncharacterized protein LOC127247052 [Andrographis paniculata]
MARSLKTYAAFKSYQNQAEVLVRNYVLGGPYIQYTSVLGGLLVFKMVYDLTQLIGSSYFQSYNGLPKIKRMDWNNRGISTLHAVFISFFSVYFVFCSELFADTNSHGIITLRYSALTTFVLGTSVGYFIADLGMICWLYPSLGGVEYVIHHSLSGIAVAYSIYMGEGQLYTFMSLISEATTPMINLRWYLDVAGLKKSIAYLINGVLIFVGWLVARILLFAYMSYHVYLHRAQVMKMRPFGIVLVLCVPVALAVMNVVWFGKILKGLKKTLAKRKS